MVDSDRFSLYAVKLKSHDDIIAIIPAGTVIVLFSAIFSIVFNSWMVTVICRYQTMNLHVFFKSLKDLIGIIRKEEEDKTRMMASIFILTSLNSAVGFTVMIIAILPIASSINLYLFQFVISSVIGTLYSPFFLICLFFILSPRRYA